MVLKQDIFIAAGFSLTREMGDVISAAVREFAEANVWGSDSYDLWYHDMRVWIVRERMPEDGTAGHTIVRRVQVAAVDAADGPQIQAIPDVYVYDQATLEQIATVPHDLRVQGMKRVGLKELEARLTPDGAERAKQMVSQVIRSAWGSAKQLPIPSTV